MISDSLDVFLLPKYDQFRMLIFMIINSFKKSKNTTKRRDLMLDTQTNPSIKVLDTIVEHVDSFGSLLLSKDSINGIYIFIYSVNSRTRNIRNFHFKNS